MTKTKAVVVAVPTQEQIQQAVDEFEAGLVVPEVMTIATGEMYEAAGAALKDIKAHIKELEAERKKLTDPIQESLKRARALFEPPLQRLTAREAAIKSAILDWNRLVERLRIEAQAKVDEQRRLEEAKTAKKAAKLAAQGKEERAEAVLANVPPPSIVVVDAPKVSGITERTTWSAWVDDLEALASHALEMGQVEALLQPNLTTLNAYARTLKGNAKMPGVRFIGTKGIAAG